MPKLRPRPPRLTGRYPYHYWILWELRDKQPAHWRTILAPIERHLKDGKLWDADRLEAPLPSSFDSTFVEEIRQAIYRDLKPAGMLSVADGVLEITDNGLEWVEKQSPPTDWTALPRIVTTRGGF